MDWLSTVPCGYLAAGEEHRILDANEEAARLLGRERTVLLGASLQALLPPSTRVFFQIYIYPTLALQYRMDELYLPLLRADGRDVPVVLNAVRTRRQGQVVDEFAFIATRRQQFVERDLIVAKTTAERAAREGREAALARVAELQAQLAAQERLAEIGTLTAGVAHEINNPLTYVSANLELLVERIQSGTGRTQRPADVDVLLQEALDGVKQIRSIVNSLRIFSRIDDERRVCVDYARVIEIARRLTTSALRCLARLDVEIPSSPVLVLGNEGRLVQVLVNLLINAAQAFPARQPDRNLIRVVASADEEFGILDVIDNGAGIPKELQPRVFEPFFTTKPVGVGTGLGLSICHNIVTSLDGTIDFESGPEGTTFRVRIPRGHPASSGDGR